MSKYGDKSVLIIGANGQLGRALQLQYPGALKADIDELDISKAASIEKYSWSGIKVVINAAAYTNVDGAETEEGREIAWQFNSVAVANLVKVCQQNKLLLIHISTDYVFDGRKDNHTENEPFSPLGVYGQTKAAGDIVVSLLPRHYLLRTSWVIGEGKNFVRTMLELGSKNISPSVVSDQIGRLTFTGELVRAIEYLLSNDCVAGTYNVTNSGEPASWADIATDVFKLTGLNNRVEKVTTQEYYAGKANIAPRPLLSTLDLTKIHRTGFDSHDWKADLSNYIKREVK